MAVVRACSWIVLIWLAVCAGAQADEGVVLLEQAGLRSRLCGALRIQLTGAAEVQCEPEGATDSLAQRISSSAERVRTLGARLGVLLERDPDPKRVRMYIVSGLGDRAVVAIESIEDRPEPDVDRSLALKVADAYQVVAAVRLAAPQSEAPVAALLAPRLTAPPAALHERGTPSGWLAFLDAGGGVSLSERTRALASLALGIGRARSGSRFELGAGVRLASRVHAQGALGRVTVHERGLQLSARLLWRLGRIELGGALTGLLAIASAEGLANDGSRGERKLLVPALDLALDLRLRLFPGASMRAAPGLELAAVRQRWAVDGSVLLDQRPARMVSLLSLVVSLPLSRESRGLQP